jgi:hypothetical protein
MNTRQHQILQLALMYMSANLNDVFDTFVSDDHPEKLDFNGEIIDKPTYDEIEQIMKELQ